MRGWQKILADSDVETSNARRPFPKFAFPPPNRETSHISKASNLQTNDKGVHKNVEISARE